MTIGAQYQSNRVIPTYQKNILYTERSETLSIEKTEALPNSQEKGIRFYDPDKHVDDNANAFTRTVQKAAGHIGNFFRRLVGQAVDIKLGDEKVTVSKTSLAKYYGRVTTGNPKITKRAAKAAFNALVANVTHLRVLNAVAATMGQPSTDGSNAFNDRLASDLLRSNTQNRLSTSSFNSEASDLRDRTWSVSTDGSRNSSLSLVPTANAVAPTDTQSARNRTNSSRPAKPTYPHMERNGSRRSRPRSDSERSIELTRSRNNSIASTDEHLTAEQRAKFEALLEANGLKPASQRTSFRGSGTLPSIEGTSSSSGSTEE